MKEMGLLASVRRFLGGTYAADPAMDDRWWSGPWLNRPSVAGVTVTPETAMMVSTIYRCVNLLANGLGTLPFGVFERLERGRKEVPDHPARRVFTMRPNPYQTAIEFKRMLMGHLALRGNCYARIIGGGRSLQLWPLHPKRVTGPELLPDGRLRYRYRRPDNNQTEVYIGGVDVWHLTGLSEDGLLGLALADLAKDSIGLAMATEQHGAKMFGKGIRLAGALKIDKTLSVKAKKELSDSFRDEHGDYGLPVLEDGMDFVQMGMTNEAAQFLETRKFSVSEIARWFGIPPHMVGDVERSTSWGTGIENQTIQFITDALLPWVKLWEESIDAVFIPEEDLYSKFNVSARLRADSKTRFEIYQIGIMNGIYSPNDCRALEDENPREGGDVYVTPRSPNEPRPSDSGGEKPPEMPPEMPPEDQTGAESAIRLLARSSADTLVAEEEAALAKLGREHAKSKGAWEREVGSFYGRWSGRVEGATLCGQRAAKAYSEVRKAIILSGGLKACEESREEAVERLVSLAVAAANGGRNAAA